MRGPARQAPQVLESTVVVPQGARDVAPKEEKEEKGAQGPNSSGGHAISKPLPDWEGQSVECNVGGAAAGRVWVGEVENCKLDSSQEIQDKEKTILVPLWSIWE